MSYQILSNEDGDLLKSYLPEQKDIEGLSKLYFAFADATRLKIIMMLCATPMCVGDLSLILNINQSTLSHQLQYLKSAGIVSCKRDKKNMTYSVVTKYVEKLIECGLDCKIV